MLRTVNRFAADIDGQQLHALCDSMRHEPPLLPGAIIDDLNEASFDTLDLAVAAHQSRIVVCDRKLQRHEANKIHFQLLKNKGHGHIRAWACHIPSRTQGLGTQPSQRALQQVLQYFPHDGHPDMDQRRVTAPAYVDIAIGTMRLSTRLG